MSNYTVTTNFGTKDALVSGDASKIVKGSEFATEFDRLAVVSAEKADLASPTFTGTVVIPTATITTANTTTANITTANITTANTTTANITTANVDTLTVDKDSDGIVVEFDQGGTLCGAIRTTGSATRPDITLGTGIVGLRFVQTVSATPNNISPYSVTDNSPQDDVINLGSSNASFDDIYATNGTIQTSDRNKKQSIEELTEAETKVAVACKGLIRKFKWNSSVEDRGTEGARYHFGVIAQDLQAAFEAEGLDAGDYGMFISSTWTNDNGEEQTRLGVRYTELLAFIIGGL